MTGNEQTLITSFVQKRKLADTSMEEGSSEIIEERELNERRHKELLQTLADIGRRVTSIDTKFDTLERKVDFISEQYENQKTVCDNLLNQNTELKLENQSIRADISAIRHDLQVEIGKRDNLENQDRKYNLEFSGVPKKEDENPKQLVNKIMKAVGVNESIDTIDIAHRKMAGGIIARFKTRTVRDEVYGKRFALVGKSSRSLGFTEDFQLYINESLTFDRSQLMKFVRDEVKTFNLNLPKERKLKVKTLHGVIKVKEPDGFYKSIVHKDDLLPLVAR